MGGHGLARPYRTHLAGCLVADGENEVQFGRAVLRELVPALATEPVRRDTELLQGMQRKRVHRTGGVATCGEGLESVATEVVQQTLGQDRARGIAGADEQHVVGLVGHGGAPSSRTNPTSPQSQSAFHPAHAERSRRSLQ
ncbi:hypothetical protein DL770_011508 [Monosporascus sp. CRB-9-2]|nr:hypothetical protein DL770_011508 [Monosporascus sp. CRB-9-2]